MLQLLSLLEDKIVARIFFISLSILALSSFALHNGYPLVYPDTGCYIGAGFAGNVPVDRPITYCLFVRHLSLATSLWFVVVSQSIILVFLFYACLKYASKSPYPYSLTLLLSIFLSACTSLSYFTSQIMPDLFTGIMLISGFLILQPNVNRIHRALIYLLFVVSLLTHFSNIITGIGTLCIYTIFIFVFQPETKYIIIKYLRTLAILLVLSILILPALHYSYEKQFSISKASHVFILGKIAEAGILSQFLYENCNGTNSALCNQKENIPTVFDEFLWNQQISPIYDSSCLLRSWDTCWLMKKDEYNKIIGAVFTSPKYCVQYGKHIIAGTLAQLTAFNIVELPAMLENSPVYPMIHWRFNSELESYTSSKQYLSSLNYSLVNNLQLLTMISSIFILLFIILNPKSRFKKEQYSFFSGLLFIIIGIILNCIVCASFSCTADRYMSRVIWIIPLITALLMLSYTTQKDSKET